MKLNISRSPHRLLMYLPILMALPLATCSNSVKPKPVLSDKQIAERHLVYPVDLPQKLDFAGEEVPLDYFDVRESLDRELLSAVYFHSQTIRYLKNMPRYFSIISPILKENGIPDDFKYLCVAESGFDPRALSPAKAAGLWQLLESTAKENGLQVNADIDERYHIEKSTAVACRLFKSAYQKYGNWALVAASYNGGRAGLDQKIATQKVNSYYDILFVEETTRYLFRIMAYKLIMNDPEKYGFIIDKKDTYPIIGTKNVEVKGPIADLSAFALKNGINLKILRMFNPWLKGNSLKNVTNQTYTIKIPEEGYRTKTQ